MARFVTVERRDDGVALVRLDRPKANALSAEVLDQLRAVAEELAADPPGAVVLWGGERIFAAGADIDRARRRGSPGHRGGRTSTPPWARWQAVPRATIAAINGYALGGGLELALACDLRVVRRRRPARSARDPARHHPRRRRHPAAAPPGRRRRGPRT